MLNYSVAELRNKWFHQLFFVHIVGIIEYSLTFAPANTEVAQLVEHWSPKPGVGSSSLSFRAKRKSFRFQQFRNLFPEHNIQYLIFFIAVQFYLQNSFGRCSITFRHNVFIGKCNNIYYRHLQGICNLQ